MRKVGVGEGTATRGTLFALQERDARTSSFLLAERRELYRTLPEYHFERKTCLFQISPPSSSKYFDTSSFLSFFFYVIKLLDLLISNN